MSTQTTPKRGRGRPRKSNATDQLILLSSPMASSSETAPIAPTIPPALESMSTSSSVTSNASSMSDAGSSKLRQTESSTTTPSESPPLPTNKLVATNGYFSPTSSTSSLSNPRLRKGRKSQTEGCDPQSLEDASTPSRQASKLPKVRKTRVSIGPASDLKVSKSLQLPPSETIRQRASSAPTLSTKQNETLDSYQLDLPGTYLESQNSIDDTESTSQDQQIQQPATDREPQPDDDNGFDSVAEDDSGDDGESQSSETSMEEGSAMEDIVSESPNGSLDEHTKDEAECPHLPFLPYSAKKGRPKDPNIKASSTINVNIMKLVSKKHQKTKNPGWVYVLKSEEYGPGFLKIGKTFSPPDNRKAELERCGLHLEEIPDIFDNSFHYYHLVEKLIQEELHNERLKIMCPKCRRKHKEWFKVDSQIALRAVEKWRNWFLVHQPFHDGELKPYWQWKAKQIERNEADIKWEEWTQPPKYEFYIYKFEAHFARSRKDGVFLFVGVLLMLISCFGHGRTGAIWAFIVLLLL